MTKEEKALIYFKDLRERKIKDYSSVFNTAPKGTVVYEAVSAEIEIYDTAIKALEQEPCEDAISRQAAINAFERFIHELGIKDEPYNYGEMALSAKNVPPVTPQPKMGCEGCTYEKIGNNSTYPCSHCSRCYTDKYKAESEVQNDRDRRKTL